MIARNAVILIDQIETEKAHGHTLGCGGGGDDASLPPDPAHGRGGDPGHDPDCANRVLGPMAYAIMGGLAVATLLTLVFLPRCTSPGSGSGCRSSRQGRSKSRCLPPASSDQPGSCPCPASGTGWPTSTVVPGRSRNWGRWARAELGTRDAHRTTLLSAIAALIGALIGGTASLLAAIYTQRYQDRLQRIAREITKREMVYADFITNASRLLLKAQVRDEIKLGGAEQQLIGLTDRMRLFAPPRSTRLRR